MLKVTLGEPRMDMTSLGDTWDASWADDGNIYIQSDDSKGSGDQPGRNLQFHVLRGESWITTAGSRLSCRNSL